MGMFIGGIRVIYRNCLTSAPMEQINGIAQERVSDSS